MQYYKIEDGRKIDVIYKPEKFVDSKDGYKFGFNRPSTLKDENIITRSPSNFKLKEKVRSGFGNYTINRPSFLAPNPLERQLLDQRLKELKRQEIDGLKVQLSESTLEKLFSVRVPDPTDKKWIDEKERILKAYRQQGLRPEQIQERLKTDPPLGREQRTTVEQRNIATSNLSMSAKINELSEEVKYGTNLGVNERGAILGQIATVLGGQLNILAELSKQLLELQKLDNSKTGLFKKLIEINKTITDDITLSSTERAALKAQLDVIEKSIVPFDLTAITAEINDIKNTINSQVIPALDKTAIVSQLDQVLADVRAGGVAVADLDNNLLVIKNEIINLKTVSGSTKTDLELKLDTIITDLNQGSEGLKLLIEQVITRIDNLPTAATPEDIKRISDLIILLKPPDTWQELNLPYRFINKTGYDEQKGLILMLLIYRAHKYKSSTGLYGGDKIFKLFNEKEDDGLPTGKGGRGNDGAVRIQAGEKRFDTGLILDLERCGFITPVQLDVFKRTVDTNIIQPGV